MMVANQAVRDFLAPATLAIWARMTALLTQGGSDPEPWIVEGLREDGDREDGSRA